MGKAMVSELLCILILASVASVAYTEFVSPLQYSYATPPTISLPPGPDIMLNGAPTVGETGEIVMTFVYDPTEWIIEDPLIEMRIQNDSKLYSVTNIISNVHTGDPDVFAPYDYLTQSTLAIPGYPYVVNGTVTILEEGFHAFSGRGLEGTLDVYPITFAIDDDRHMPYSTYINEGHTFLDHTRTARGASNDLFASKQQPLPPPPTPAPKDNSAGLTHQEMISELEDYIASVYIAQQPSHKVLLDELQNIHLTVPQIKEFLKNKVSFSEEDINDIVDTIPDDYGLDDIAAGQTGHFAKFEVSGLVTAPQYYYEPGDINVHGIEICALDYNPSNNEFVVLNTTTDNETACGYTSQLGIYHIQNIRNLDPNDDRPSNTDVDLVIRVRAASQTNIEIVNVELFTYAVHSARMDDFSKTSLITNFQLTDEMGGVGRIIDTIADGFDFFDDYLTTESSLAIYWQYDAGASAFENVSRDGARYFRNPDSILLDGAIEGKYGSDNSFERWVILHEFAHHIMDISEVFVGRCDVFPHVGNEVSSSRCAWTEGWADFVPHLVDNEARLQIFTRGTEQQPVKIYSDMEVEQFPDTNGKLRIFERYINDVSVGHQVEGQVAAAMWDIKDTLNNTIYDRVGILPNGAILDNQALGNDDIIEVFMDKGYHIFEEFYDAWNAQGKPSIQNIMQLHAMGFAPNADPIVLTDADSAGIITLNPIVGGGQENGSSVPLPINEDNIREIIRADANGISNIDLSDVVISDIVQVNLSNPNGLRDIDTVQQFHLGDSIAYSITDPNYRDVDAYSFQVTINNTDGNRYGIGNMTIMLGEPLTCEAQITTDAINFGELVNGEASNDQSFITINNTGSLAVLPGITAKHWVSSVDADVIIMDAQQTRWTLDSSTSYNNKTPLSFNVTQNVGVSLDRHAIQNVYLQLLVDLIDDAHRGQAVQDLTVSSTCE